MCEVLSWRDEIWWERKSIPVGSHTVSPRQIIILVAFMTLGYLISSSVPNVLFGANYLGRLMPILATLVIGLVIGSHRIRLIPLEFQLFLKLTGNKYLRVKREASS